jgi:signal transduction histidine kinase
MAKDLPPLISIDAAKIAWVTTMLVGNALRYVRHGTRAMPGGTIAVRVTHDAVVRTVSIEVEDDGPGIPHESLRGLFTTDDGRPPAALGLLLAREIAIAHGGGLDLRSDTESPRHGTTVRVTLSVGGAPWPSA